MSKNDPHQLQLPILVEVGSPMKEKRVSSRAAESERAFQRQYGASAADEDIYSAMANRYWQGLAGK
ncbi:hypothetical protein [Pluralibacter gergoviae]|uniref:Uncharacterized protein n=1 Tax=Pluralibacter gergoviae TaxID=61647 RepID=A0AAW8HKZ6_PLUGE|nr:hypothetical protein [Pluralibacter gergoviae]AIR03007.1 hypothetical protein LG71_25275 [Pluralibacter gergoviae]AVR02711.1 hypothetical protein A8H26_08435 [Pluralibacter gergoviae]EKV0931844.1 hypothetical protein [Pluralibacter gergoviae]EKV6248787.1 hypothetical protein [Pluralibacter gergoviae]EKW6616899.1 hypothetical protein [Pluralibacter gergoviae]